MRPAAIPNSVALTSETMTSGMPVSSVRPATNAPGETCWTYTQKKNAPLRPTKITVAESRGAEFGQQNVEGEHQKHRVRHRQHQCRQDRNPRHEPTLNYVFLPGE